MKFGLTALIVSALLVFGSTGYARENIPDSSFENHEMCTQTSDNGNVKISYGENMLLYEGAKDLCNISVAEGVAHTGNRSLLMNYYKDNKPSFRFKVEPDKLYVFSAYMKLHPDTFGASYSLYSPPDSYCYIFPFGVPAKISPIAYPSYFMPQQEKVYSTPIGRGCWTEIKRYIYVNSDTGELNLKFFDYATQQFKFYIDDVTLTPVEDDSFKAIWSTGADKLNSTDAGEYRYSAEFTLFDSPLSCYCYDSGKQKNLPKNQSVRYSLNGEYNGVSIDSVSGGLNVSPGAEAEIEIIAEIKLGDADTRYENVRAVEKTITKKVSISPYEQPSVESVGSEISDFSSDTFNYYGIRSEELPVFDINSDSSITIESLSGILSGIRLTATKNGEDRIYNFYVTNPWKNMLKDGGFEDGSGLEEFITDGGSMSLSEISRTGNNGLEFTAPPYNGIASEFDFKPDRLYIYSAWVKAKDTSVSKILKFHSVRAGTQAAFSFSPKFIENYMYDKVNISDSEWTQIVRVFYVTQEVTARVVLQNAAGAGKMFEGYIDDVFIAELNTGNFEEAIKNSTIDSVVKNENSQDKSYSGKVEGDFVFLNYQNKSGENQSVNVLIKGIQPNQKLMVIISEYDENGKLILNSCREINSDGVYLFDSPQSGHRQKVFFWDMHGIKPMTEALSK